MSYEDILHLPHHVSARRRQMSNLERAAQFSPFAALTGHDAAIRETARLTDDRFDLADDGTAMLDEKLRILLEHRHSHPEITAVYFVPDERKSGGAYVTVTGRLTAVSSREQALILEDGRELYFSRIYGLDSSVF